MIDNRICSEPIAGPPKLYIQVLLPLDANAGPFGHQLSEVFIKAIAKIGKGPLFRPNHNFSVQVMAAEYDIEEFELAHGRIRTSIESLCSPVRFEDCQFCASQY